MKVSVAIAAVAASLPTLVSAQGAGYCGGGGGGGGGGDYANTATPVAGYTPTTTPVAGYTPTTAPVAEYTPTTTPVEGYTPTNSVPGYTPTTAPVAEYTATTTPVEGYTPTTSVPGYTPTTSDAGYTPTTTTTTSDYHPKPTPSDTGSACSGATKFKYFGVNQAGAEFAGSVIPGQLGTHYTWPKTSSVDYFLDLGMNTFRIPFSMERLVPPAQGLAGTMDATYLAALKNIATYITGKGAHAIIDPHNYGRYNGAIITDTAAFGKWCKNIASEFKSDYNIIFDTNNEYHDMDQELVFNLNQACINGIRAAGATSQLILVEGNSWTGAWSWVSSGNAASMIDLEDPNDNIAFEMHQYLDGDSSGTSQNCVSSTIGAERLTAATNWLKHNGKKGFLGEMGAGSNDACIAAVYGALCHMQQAGGVWIGALWWAAGPWWGNYFQSIEPPDGASISRILPEALMPFV